MFTRPIARPRPRRAAFLFVFSACLLAPALLRAQPLADRVPADAVLYFGWQGADAMPSAYAQSHLKAVLDASDLRKLFDEFLPALQKRAAQENAQASEMADLFSSLAKPMWRHPTAVFFGGFTWGAPGAEPTPKMALICQAGAESAALAQKIDGLIKQGPPEMQRLARTEVAADMVVISVGYKDNDLAATGRGKSLANSAAFKAAAGQVGRSPAGIFYLDAERAMAEVDAAVKASGDPGAAQNWPKARDASGIAGLKQIIWTTGLDGADWGSHTFVRAPEPRKGILALGDPTYVSDAALALVPQTATAMGAAKFNLPRLIAGIRELAVGFDPNAGQQFDEAMKQASQMLGMDVQKDFLAALGDEWVYYTDPAVGGRGLMGFVGINRLKDPAKAGAALAKIEGMANSILAQQLKDEEVKFQFFTTTTKVGGADVTIHYAGSPLISPAWAVHGGNLYVGLFPQTVAAALDTAAAKGKTILDNADFVALRKRLGGQNGGSISFLDLPRTAPDAYAQWTMISRATGIADLFGVKSPTMVLPPLSRLMPHLSPAGAVGWMDKEGWHMRSVSPFPGSTALASDPLTGMYSSAPMMASIMLPALNRAREQANRIKSASNLRQMAMAGLMAANEDRKGAFPREMGELLKQDLMAPEVFISPRTTTERPPFNDPQRLAAWVNQNADYAWIGAGLTNRQGPDFILAYEKPAGLSDGINIVFADGHVEFLMMPEAQRRLAAQAELRKKASLPPPPPTPTFDGGDGNVRTEQIGPIPIQPDPVQPGQ